MATDAVEYNGWEIVTGQDFREVLRLKDPSLPKISNPDYDPKCPENESNPKELFQAKDLTDYTAQMDLVASDGTLVKSLGIGTGITIGQPDPDDGTIEIFIDNTVTKVAPILDQAGKKLNFDLFIIPPSPQDNKRIIFGQIPVVKAFTDV